MARSIKLSMKDLEYGLKREIEFRIGASGKGLAEVIKKQAVRRIKEGGDSEVHYEDLWATQAGIGVRRGGTPLRDTGFLLNGLRSDWSPSGRGGTTLHLIDSTGYGIKHDVGFTNKAPIAIPLSNKGKRLIPKESPHDIKALKGAGLKQAPNKEEAELGSKAGRKPYDFYVLRKDAKVPARPIINMAPENLREFGRAILQAIRMNRVTGR